MVDRARLSQIREAPTLDASNNVVDTFVTPFVQKQGESGLQQLAKALSSVEPALMNIAQTEVRKYTDEEIQAGMEAARQNAMGFQEAIKQGIIPAGASPWYKKGYKNELGVAAGRGYQDFLSQNWQQWDQKEDDDPRVFQQWLAEQRKSYADAQPEFADTDFAKGFNPKAALVENNLATHQASYHAKRIEEKREGLIYQNIISDVEQFSETGDMESMINSIQTRNQQFYVDGGSGTKANELTLQAVAAIAYNKRDERLLDVLDHIPSGSGLGTLAKTKTGRELIQQTRDKIYSKIIQEDNFMHTQQERAKEKAIGEASSAVYDMIINNPMADIPDELMKKATALDKDFPKYVTGLRNAITSDNARESDWEVSQVQYCVFSGGCGVTDINKAVMNGVLRDKNTISDLYRAVQRQSEKKGYGASPHIDQVLKELENGTYRAVKGNDMDFNAVSAHKATQARVVFMMSMQDFIDNNPKATSQEILKHASEMNQYLVKAYGSDVDAADMNKVPGITNQATGVHQGKMNGDPEWTYMPLFQNQQDMTKARQDGRFEQMLQQLGITGAEDVRKFYDTQMRLINGGQ